CPLQPERIVRVFRIPIIFDCNITSFLLCCFESRDMGCCMGDDASKSQKERHTDSNKECFPFLQIDSSLLSLYGCKRFYGRVVPCCLDRLLVHDHFKRNCLVVCTHRTNDRFCLFPWSKDVLIIIIPILSFFRPVLSIHVHSYMYCTVPGFRDD